MKAYGSALISESAREQLRILLNPKPLKKGDGEYEIGYETAKRDILESISAFAGGNL